MEKVTRYEVREYVGSAFSKQLGRRLRTREQALRIVRILKKAGREAFVSPLRIAA